MNILSIFGLIFLVWCVSCVREMVDINVTLVWLLLVLAAVWCKQQGQ